MNLAAKILEQVMMAILVPDLKKKKKTLDKKMVPLVLYCVMTT